MQFRDGEGLLPELAEGTKIAGRYVLLRRLGIGGMGEVWLAMLEAAAPFRRRVVVKLVSPDRRGDDRIEQMLADEARVLGLLHHQGIVTAVDFQETDLGPVLVLDYVDGPSLRSALKLARKRGISLPPELAAYIGAEVARALDFAHRASDANGHLLDLVHRDVSPDNVLLSSDGGVLIADFGVARALGNSEVTHPGTAPKGKRGYMAPEQAAGQPIGPGADVYALGKVIAEAIDGEPLPALKAVLDKATAADVKDRYPSAADLAAGLSEACPPPQEPTKVLAAWLLAAAPEALSPRETSPGPTPSRATQPRLGRGPPTPEPLLFESVTKRMWPAPIKIVATVAAILIVAIPIGLWISYGEAPRRFVGKLRKPTGELRIVSAPTGAEVYVDGSLRGYAPLLVKVPPGRHQIRVGSPRLERWRAVEVVVEQDKAVSREIDLTE